MTFVFFTRSLSLIQSSINLCIFYSTKCVVLYNHGWWTTDYDNIQPGINTPEFVLWSSWPWFLAWNNPNIMGRPAYHHSDSSSVDRGYAWVVLASCFVLRLLVDSFWSSLGILFLKWQAHFDVSVSSTAWIGSSFMLILCSTGKCHTLC